ncbi:NAD(P)H-binding protein [Kineosporiaceae bacterium SCSIO 59966]|nr:NAD(P)H-binding protein [Kineosporiaceae bacterium SCSIO 59966]
MATVAVTGASGKTGRALTAALRARGVAVRGLHRPGTDLDTGRGLDALAGCDAVAVIVPNVHPDEPGVVARVLAAARRHGVRRVVYHSVAQPYAPAMPHHVDKAVAEDLVRRSGTDWTVLQPCAYTQNLLPGLAAAEPELAVPYSTLTPFAFVDLADVAEATATVLREDGHVGATYELGGPGAVSVADVAAAASEVLGRPVRARRTDPREWAAGPGAALPAEARRRLLAMFASYDEHGLLAGSLVLRALLGRPSADVRAVLTRHLVR